jgi:2-polyprenyl-3-methyl-5-hydroxy-6-metoxy-1,4-benzoquinol methylase
LEDSGLSEAVDRAGRAYWDSVWSEGGGGVTHPASFSHVQRRFASAFDAVLSELPPSSSVLEIGCANSIWLPYIAGRFDFRVVGIDYSELGCEQTRAMYKAAGINAEVLCSDAFSPLPELVGRFDVVFSMGVVEHFDDTATTLRAFAAYAQPGGTLLTVVPNMRGLTGFLQRLFNPRLFRAHVPLTPHALAQAYSSAGLDLERYSYFIASNFGVVDLRGLDPMKTSTRLKRSVHRNLCRLSHAIWIVDDIVDLPAVRPFAGYAICVGHKSKLSNIAP